MGCGDWDKVFYKEREGYLLSPWAWFEDFHQDALESLRYKVLCSLGTQSSGTWLPQVDVRGREELVSYWWVSCRRWASWDWPASPEYARAKNPRAFVQMGPHRWAHDGRHQVQQYPSSERNSRYCAGSQREELRPWQRSWGRRLRHTQRRDQASGNPVFPSIYPKSQSLPTLLFYALTYTSDFTGGCSPTIPLGEGVNLQLQLTKIPGCDKSVSAYGLLWRLSSPPV